MHFQELIMDLNGLNLSSLYLLISEFVFQKIYFYLFILHIMTNEIEQGIDFKFDFTKLKKVQQKVKADVIPVGVQHAETKELLIIAYANKEALDYSIKNRIAAFWSTSRNELWVKGKTSGDVLELVEIRVNCDQNSLIYLVKPKKGGVCHTKDSDGNTRDTCYYRKIDLDKPSKLVFLSK